MHIVTYLKRKITGRHQSMTGAQAERIARLQKEQARRELGAFLFEVAVHHATEFVKDDLMRSEAAFRGIPAETVFHEMLAVAFWVMDNEVAGGGKTLVPELHELYFRTYRNIPGSPDERSRTLGERYKQYANEWDDHTGHQDEFGLCVAQNLFGKEPSELTRSRCFWVIRYAHDVVNDIAPVKKTFRRKFSPDPPPAAA